MFKRVIILSILCCVLVLVAATDPCDLNLFCTPSQVLECVQSVKFDDSYYKEAVDDIVKSIEPYVYLDILKNPPQPEGFPSYFEPVDLISKLKAVKTEGVAYYDFFREVQKILMSAQEGHFGFKFASNGEYDVKLLKFMVLLPLSVYTEADEQGLPLMKGKPLDISFGDIYSSFDKGADVKAMTEKNVDVPIASINDVNPFEFVYSFGSEYYNIMKNMNAKYTYVLKMLRSI